MPKQEIPAGLGLKGTKFWKETVEAYELRPHELSILEDVCHEIDLIEELQSRISAQEFELRTKGSMGQLVAAPELDQIRHHRAQKQRLIASLKLPEEDDVPASRSTSARAAANARWRRGATA